MIEKIKAVNNPLTIIAIFAALAEIASTIAVIYVRPELQYIFIWFVIGFPALLVILFFLTLNFNHKVLYAPSDFKDEQNFLDMLKNEKTSQNLDVIEQAIETAKHEIETKIKVFDEAIQTQISQTVVKNFDQLKEKIEITKVELEEPNSLESITNLFANRIHTYRRNNYESGVLEYLKSQKEYVTAKRIASDLKMNRVKVNDSLRILKNLNLLETKRDIQGGFDYYLLKDNSDKL